MNKSMAAAALVAMIALGGCSTQSEAQAPKVDAAGESSTPATESAAPEKEEGPKKSDRGNIIKELGEGAGVSNYEKESIAEFVVNGITVDPACTAEYSAPPENGHFIALDVSVKTYPELAEDSYPKFDLNPHGMKIIAPNGTTSNVNLATGPAYMCLPEIETLPSGGIGPAENVTGKIVIDSEIPAGTLVITLDGMLGWEYEFGAVPPNA